MAGARNLAPLEHDPPFVLPYRIALRMLVVLFDANLEYPANVDDLALPLGLGSNTTPLANL
eukprot:2746828-Alexandrium_andersonii.AAC.1